MDSKRSREIILECIRQFYEQYPEAKKFLDIDTSPLNEMAMSIKDYEELITARAIGLYNTACNICCLENISGAVQHWRHELIVWFSDLLKPAIKKGVSKRERLIKELIAPVINPDTYEADEPELFARAMRAELRKAERCQSEDRKRYQIEASYIKEYILPNIDAYCNANKVRVGQLFKNAVDAICDADYDALVDVIDTFINDRVDV